MYQEEDYLPLSAIQHFLFCPRQCALIHIEHLWQENVFTVEGRLLHEKAHEQTIEKRNDLRIERGISLRSDALGLIGKADVVEYHKISAGLWRPYPIEYKRGRPKIIDCDKVQLCAQAICLEEALKMTIVSGAIFYGRTLRRQEVLFDENIRAETVEAAFRLHEFLSIAKTPRPQYSDKCESCSLIDLCMPRVAREPGNIDAYLKKAMAD